MKSEKNEKITGKSWCQMQSIAEHLFFWQLFSPSKLSHDSGRWSLLPTLTQHTNSFLLQELMLGSTKIKGDTGHILFVTWNPNSRVSIFHTALTPTLWIRTPQGSRKMSWPVVSLEAIRGGFWQVDGQSGAGSNTSWGTNVRVNL